MNIASWLLKLPRWETRPARRAVRQKRSTCQLTLEQLEDRLTPSFGFTWPEGTAVRDLLGAPEQDNVARIKEPSGLAWNESLQKLFVVGDGNLNHVGLVSLNDQDPTQIEKFYLPLTVNTDADAEMDADGVYHAEGVTFVDTNWYGPNYDPESDPWAHIAFVAREDVRIDMNGDGAVVAAESHRQVLTRFNVSTKEVGRSFDLTDYVLPVDYNKGIEGVAFVADAAAGDDLGFFYVYEEGHNGRIHKFRLDISDPNSSAVLSHAILAANLTTRAGSVGDIAYYGGSLWVSQGSGTQTDVQILQYSLDGTRQGAISYDALDPEPTGWTVSQEGIHFHDGKLYVAKDSNTNPADAGLGYHTIWEVPVHWNDTTAPVSVVAFPTAGGTYHASDWSDAISGTASDVGLSGVKQVEVSILRRGSGKYWDGDGFDSTTQVFLTASGTRSWELAFPDEHFLVDGGYTLTVRAEDFQGNIGSVTARFTFIRSADDVAPTTTIDFPTADGLFNATTWTGTITGAASDNTGGSGLNRVEVSIQRQGDGIYWNGTGFSSAAETFTVAAGTASWSLAFPVANFPTDGAYRVRSRAIDNAGNIGASVATSFTLDRTRPTTTISSSAVTTSEVRFDVVFLESVSGFDAADVVLYENGVELADQGGLTVQIIPTGPFNNQYTVVISGMTRNMRLGARIRGWAALDDAGNRSLPSGIAEATFTFNA